MFQVNENISESIEISRSWQTNQQKTIYCQNQTSITQQNIFLNIYLGLAILEISKTVIDKILIVKPKYGKK